GCRPRSRASPTHRRPESTTPLGGTTAVPRTAAAAPPPASATPPTPGSGYARRGTNRAPAPRDPPLAPPDAPPSPVDPRPTARRRPRTPPPPPGWRPGDAGGRLTTPWPRRGRRTCRRSTAGSVSAAALAHRSQR